MEPARRGDELGVDLARALAGDRAALRAVWAANRRWVAAVIIAHKPASADVDDLLQEVAATLIAKVHTLSDPASLGPWLRTVAVNAARLAGRKHVVATAARSVVNDEASRRYVDSLERTADRPSAVREEAERVFALAMDLPEEYREPLLLRCVQELSYRQISEILDLPETTVETRIARARRMVRERTAQQELSPRMRVETRREAERAGPGEAP